MLRWTFFGTFPASPLVKSLKNVSVSPCENTGTGKRPANSKRGDNCKQKLLTKEIYHRVLPRTRHQRMFLLV